MKSFGRRTSGVVGAVFALLLLTSPAAADLGDLIEALENALASDVLDIGSPAG
jgi:hypothetical protein